MCEIDTNREKLLTVSAAATLSPGKPHISTVWRWIREGCNGVRLRTIKVGGRRYTSHEALAKFFSEVTEASEREVIAS